jgi:hypothetical protein
VVASELYAYVYPAGNNFILTDLLVSDDGITYVDESISNALDEKFVIEIANIDITEVI